MTRGRDLAGEVDAPQQRLAERLREMRDYLGLSQQYVADQTGISRVAISSIENARRRVEALELERLARLYRQPTEYFLEGDPGIPPTVRALAREAVGLSEQDREELVRFAQFLGGMGRRDRGNEDSQP